MRLSTPEIRHASRRSALLRSGASLLAVTAMLTAAPALAQVQTQDPDDDEDVAQVEEVVVTGIRGSLRSSQAIKQNADVFVDSITSEDIGALPDRSVTEALQRVPGVAIDRFAAGVDPDHFSVEGSGVVVRGLNFVRSEFNGRTAFSAGVGGQALNFADVPAELLGSVIISKNATADMIEGGLAGTVNLNTRKPFDNDGFKIGFSLEANYGDFQKDWTPNISGLVSNVWDTDAGRFGVLISGAFSQIKSRADGLQVANYQIRDGQTVPIANTANRFICRNPLPADVDNTTLPPPNAASRTMPTTASRLSAASSVRRISTASATVSRPRPSGKASTSARCSRRNSSVRTPPIHGVSALMKPRPTSPNIRPIRSAVSRMPTVRTWSTAMA